MYRFPFLTLATALALAYSATARADLFLGKSVAEWSPGLEAKAAGERRSAAFALGRCGADAEGVVPRLLDCVTEDKDVGVQAAAAMAIGDIVLAMNRRDNQPQPTLQDPTLPPMPPKENAHWEKVGPVLIRKLGQETDPPVKRGLAYALGAFGTQAGPAAPSLTEALRDKKNATVRQNAAWALGRIGAAAKPPVVNDLCALLADEEPLVRRDAATALGDIGLPTAESAVAPLIDLIQREAGAKGDPVVLKTALEKLVNLANKSHQPLAPRLEPLLKNDDPETARAAAFALVNIGQVVDLDSLSKVLGQALKDEEIRVVEQAALAVAHLGKHAGPLVGSLGDLLEHKERSVRRAAAGALSVMEPGAAAAALPQLLKVVQTKLTVEDYPERLLSARALNRMDYPANEKAIEPLLRILEKSTEPGDVRLSCIYATWQIRDLKLFDLQKSLEAVMKETSPLTAVVRYVAAQRLAVDLGPNVPDKVPELLLEMLKNTGLVLNQGGQARVEGVGSEAQGNKPKVETNRDDARFLAAQSLGRLGKKAKTKEILEALEAAATDKDKRLQEAAKEALKLIRGS
jgi:HEAT repeat protein